MRRFLFAAAAAVLSACAGGGFPVDVVTHDRVEPNYDPASVSVFAGAGGYAAIFGATRDGAGPAEIASALRLPAHVAPRTLRAAPAGEPQSGPHLVLVFAPDAPVSPLRACRGEASGGVAGPRLKVFGVFCSSYGTPVSTAQLALTDSPIPADPDFGRRLSALINALAPAANPDQGAGLPERVP